MPGTLVVYPRIGSIHAQLVQDFVHPQYGSGVPCGVPSNQPEKDTLTRTPKWVDDFRLGQNANHRETTWLLPESSW